jgi:predicted ATPase
LEGNKQEDWREQKTNRKYKVISTSESASDNSISEFRTVYFREGFRHNNSDNSYSKHFFSKDGLDSVDFGSVNIRSLWNVYRNEIEDYNNTLTLKIDSILSEIQKSNAQTDDLVKAVAEWKNSNPSPLKHLAENFLNVILNFFDLEIETELTKEVLKNHRFIPVKKIGSTKSIVHDLLSSGTQNILYVIAALYKLRPSNAIILFDEVENSLYPNIQQIIIDHYTKLAPNNQFFFATHSPIIASSFDPWEIVELIFDKDGYVIQDKYYKGERHVNNYFIHPKFLRWDAILTDMFDLDSEGNEEHEKLLQELAVINNKLKKLNGKIENEQTRLNLLDEKHEVYKKLRWKYSTDEKVG